MPEIVWFIGIIPLFPSQYTMQYTMRTFLLPAFSCAALAVVLVLQTGCGGGDGGRPADMPKLIPVSIAVTQSGQPLEGAIVTLVSKTPATYGTASGMTNAAGIANVRTYGFDGVPEGDYVVVIEKRVIENQRESSTLEGLPMMVGGQLYQYVEEQYTNENDTPYSLTVSGRGTSERFDVGGPVRVLLQSLD